MSRASPVSWRRTSIVLAAALAVVCACGKKKDENRTGQLTRPAMPADPALTDAVAGRPAETPPAPPPEVPPAWTQEAPHFFKRGGRRFAAAVGWAKTGNLSLARSAAEDSARVALLRLITGAEPGKALEGALPGAKMTDSFASEKGGPVFVRLEVPAPPPP